MNDWAVYRQDFTGNEFLVEKNLSENRARNLVVEYESHGHHQHYWAAKQPADRPDLAALAKQMLADGSSISLAIPVLATYNVSNIEIVDAIAASSELDRKEIEKLVQLKTDGKRE